MIRPFSAALLVAALLVAGCGSRPSDVDAARAACGVPKTMPVMSSGVLERSGAHEFRFQNGLFVTVIWNEADGRWTTYLSPCQT